MAGNVWKSIFQTFNPFKKGMNGDVSVQREIDRGEVEVDGYYAPASLSGGGGEEDNIFAVYLASMKIGEYRDQIYDEYSAVRSNYLVQSILEIMTDDCLRPDKSTGNIVNITSTNAEWNQELKRLQDRIDFDAMLADITPEILLYGEYAQHLIFEQGVGIVDIEDVYDIKNILPIYKGGKIKSYLIKSDSSNQATGNALLPETMRGVAFETAPIYKYVYYVRAGKRIRVKSTRPAFSQATNQFEVDKISANVRIGRSVIPSSLIPLIKSLTTLEIILPLVRILQLDKRSLVGIRFPGVTKLERVQNTVQEYERMINDTWRTANIASTGEFNVQDLISSITKFRVVPLLGDKGCFVGDTEIAMYCGESCKIRDLVGLERFVVYSYDLELKQIVAGTAHSCRKTIENAPILKITLDNGVSIRCTYDHKFLMRDGRYKEAQNIEVGEGVMPLYRRNKQAFPELDELVDSSYNREEIYQPGKGWTPTRDTIAEYHSVSSSPDNHKVLCVEPDGFEDVYDFTVDTYHNFALAAGVFVHNSIEMQDIPSPEIGTLEDFDYIKKTVFEGVGVPSAYVLGGEGKENLKSYVRYLKKQASIQRSLIIGIKHIATVNLRALGHKATPADINVEFANLISIENLDELEYLDILTSLLRNYWEFVRDMDDVDGPTPGIVNWGEVMSFLYNKLQSFAGSEKFLEKNVEYFKKVGVLPIQTKTVSGVDGAGGAGDFGDTGGPAGAGGEVDFGGGAPDLGRGDTGFNVVPPGKTGEVEQGMDQDYEMSPDLRS